jgi:aspartate ammonia-lyase
MPDTTGLKVSDARSSEAPSSHEQFIHGDEHIGTTGPNEAHELMSGDGPTRTETDSLGSMEIPADVYWGIHTARALINFPISRRAISNYPDLVRALALVKQASARANKEIGVLDAKKADLIDAVCQRIVDGELHDRSWSV